MNGNQFCNPATISLLALRPDAPNRCSADLDSNSCATSIERETRRTVQTRPASALCFNHLARTAHKKRKRFAVLWACWGSTPQWSFNAIHSMKPFGLLCSSPRNANVETPRSQEPMGRQGHKNRVWLTNEATNAYGVCFQTTAIRQTSSVRPERAGHR